MNPVEFIDIGNNPMHTYCLQTYIFLFQYLLFKKVEYVIATSDQYVNSI